MLDQLNLLYFPAIWNAAVQNNTDNIIKIPDVIIINKSNNSGKIGSAIKNIIATIVKGKK